MGQEEILKLLKKKKVWLTSNEIRDSIEDGKRTVTNSCGILFKSGEIERKKRKKRWYWEYYWRCKK